MKASYETTIKYLDAGCTINEYDNCGHKWMSVCGRILTDKAKEQLWRNDYLVDVMGTELDTAICRVGLKHVWVRGH